jgi:hypothetical protein
MVVFKLKIDLDDETGLTFNALVDDPAHRKNFLAFNKNQKQVFLNEEKRMVTGVAISANQYIRRFDAQMGEYFVYFPAEEVKKMILKMSRQQLLSSVNLMHDNRKVVKGITFVEGYFVDETKRPPAALDVNVNDGSYVMTYFVSDDQVWADIKNGKYLGFSIEGLFEQVEANLKTKHKMKKKNKSLIDYLFGKTKQKFGSATTVDGVEITWEGELVVGTVVSVTDAEGNKVTASGTLVLEDGTTLVLDDEGAILEVAMPEEFKDEEVAVAEVVEAMKKMATEITALKAQVSNQKEAFEAYKKEQVPGVQKFARKEGQKSWKDLIAK